MFKPRGTRSGLRIGQRYVLAVAFSAAALGLRFSLGSALGVVQPFAIFYLSVALTAWWAGLGPAILASVLGLVAGFVFILEPHLSLAVGNLVAMLTYVAVSACFVLLLRHARREETRAENQRALLEAVLEACPAGVIVADSRGKILRMNQANQRLWGHAPFSESVEDYREWKGWWADGTERNGRRVEPHEWAMARALQGKSVPGDIVEIEPFDEPDVRRTMINSGAPVVDWAGRVEGAVVAQMDITERRRAEVELRYRSDQLATLIKHAPLGVLLIDADFRISMVNPIGMTAFEGIPGVVGRDFGDVLRIQWPRDVADEIVRIFRHSLATGEPHHVPEMVQVRADRGVTEYYDWRVNRITQPDGRYGLVSYYSDISVQVRAREAIAASEERYRSLFTSIDAGFCVVEMIFDENEKPTDYRFIEINPAFKQQTGMENAEGRTIREIVPDLESIWVETYGRVALSGEPTRFLNEAKPLGRWFDVYACRLGNPKERRVAVLFNDFTARKRAEEALEKANEKLQITLNSISDGLLVMDHEWRYTYFSEPAARMLGLRVEDLVGGIVWDLFPESRGTKFDHGYHEAVATGKPVHFEEYYPAPLNKWIECHCYPSRDGLSVYFHDVTERKHTEEALALANSELERHAAVLEQTVADRTAQLTESINELESFSYSLSHDMRAPLRAMMGFSRILVEDYAPQLGPEGGNYLRRISTAADRLDQLIQDVLAYSKVVRGSILLQPLSVESLTRQLIEENPVLQEPQAEIEIKSPLLPVMGHGAYLVQVLSNLLYNAVKFVPAGRNPHVRIWTERVGGRVRLSIQDHGIGIPSEAQAKIFGMFERVHSEREYEGTGIGLAIVRKAVERMNGRVGVESERDQGSTFWVELASPTEPTE